MIEAVELCATCCERTPHSRRQHAPLRWLATITALLAALLAVAALARSLPLAGPASLVLALLALTALRADRARRWDLACTRCRRKAVAASRPARRRWRLPLRATTIDTG